MSCTVRRAALAVFMSVSVVACGTPPLRNARESPDALARAVLDALAGKDAKALRALTFDEQEFREQVWPELPASRPERNLPFGYVWTDLRTKSEAGLASILAEHGGRSYVLEKVGFTGDTTQYRTFVVHRDAVLVVRDGDDARREVQLFGSVLEKDGRFKVFSYIVD